MLIQICCKDQNVVNINYNFTRTDFLSEDLIHHTLERGWCIAQTKLHNKWLIETMVSNKCSFMLITFSNSDIVKAPSDIHFGEIFGALETVD